MLELRSEGYVDVLREGEVKNGSGCQQQSSLIVPFQCFCWPWFVPVFKGLLACTPTVKTK